MMNQFELQRKIASVAATLGTITVCGKENCKLMAGCIAYLEDLVGELTGNKDGADANEDYQK